MKCPTCPDQTLVMTDRSGVEIDYCPSCRGVWLDRGELDKIIDRSTAVNTASSPDDRGGERGRGDDHVRWPSDRGYDDDRHLHDKDGKPKKRKRESFLGDLFDF